jgi:ribonuclease BN (tRNA processing enzyme)
VPSESFPTWAKQSDRPNQVMSARFRAATARRSATGVRRARPAAPVTVSAVLLTIVGCSGSAPGPDSACSCYLIQQDGFALLLDAGNGASGPLQRYAAPQDVDAVILSHAHADHYIDISQLQYLRNVTGAPPLPIIAPANLPGLLLLIRPESWAITTPRPGPVQLGPLAVRQARVAHGQMECWATRIGDQLCYTADTEPCAALDELADGCGVLLAEASGLDGDQLPRHLTAGDAGRLAARSRTRLLILTHLRPWLDHPALLAEAARHAPCPVILARPGLRVALTGGQPPAAA